MCINESKVHEIVNQETDKLRHETHREFNDVKSLLEDVKEGVRDIKHETKTINGSVGNAHKEIAKIKIETEHAKCAAPAIEKRIRYLEDCALSQEALESYMKEQREILHRQENRRGRDLKVAAAWISAIISVIILVSNYFL